MSLVWFAMCLNDINRHIYNYKCGNCGMKYIKNKKCSNCDIMIHFHNITVLVIYIEKYLNVRNVILKVYN